MTAARFIGRSLLFHWRAHVGLFLGAALAAAILTGALTVGDSVRFSLRRIALARLGSTGVALNAPAHFVREELANEIGIKLKVPIVAPLLMARATVAVPDGRARANEVQIVGVDERFWKIGGVADPFAGAGPGEFIANDVLADQLGLKQGDAVVIRLEKPSLLSHEAPLSGARETSVAIRARMRAIAGSDQFGHFSLRANQIAPPTVFVPLHSLQADLEQPGRANVLLVAGENRVDVSAANAALRQSWTLADLGLEIREVGQWAELRTERVFLDPAVSAAATHAAPGGAGVLTYLVNGIELGTRATPYSMVVATDIPIAPLPPLAEDEIDVSSWLADDLAAKPGDLVTLRYFVLPASAKLSERTRQFRVRTVLGAGPADPSWMPPFPGLADVENCRDWEPGIPLDLSRIRPKDEQYWKDYRGTPKAFISLHSGQSIFENRFGNLTAIRYPLKSTSVDTIGRAVHQAIDPKAAGLSFQPVRDAAQAASGGSQDFGQLFLGFSFFLIVAAELLMAMLFVLNLDQRLSEAGILLALGFTHQRVRRFFLLEGCLVAGLGTLVGVVAGAGYTKLALHGLSTVWHDAVNFSEFRYHAEPLTLLIGVASSLFIGMVVTWLAGRSYARRTAIELLSGTLPVLLRGGKYRMALAFGALCLVCAVALLAVGAHSAEAFFEAGGLLLIAGVAFSRSWLGRLAHGGSAARHLVSIGIRGAARRPGRSLTVVAVLGAGIFMVVGTGAFREDPLRHADERASGTGGFALYGQSTLPVYEDLDSSEGRTVFGLTSHDMQSVAVVPMRVKDGDDASCLNLNRAQQPRFLGVRPDALASRKAFTFIETAGGSPGQAEWRMLEHPESDGAVPAVGDEATARWALGKSVGDTIEVTSERGVPFRVRIVGMVADSILQGSLVIGEEAFMKRFPSSGGARAFLIDAPPENVGEVRKVLSHAMQGRGLEVVSSWRRLAGFQAVENSYLSIFQALGGLGLLLGSVGLGIVVMRNVFERRNELALLQAVGFSPRAVRFLVVSEHWFLLALGAGVGGTAAAVAVLPSLLRPGSDASWGWEAVTLGLLVLGGAVWSWLAAWVALRGNLIEALRAE